MTGRSQLHEDSRTGRAEGMARAEVLRQEHAGQFKEPLVGRTGLLGWGPGAWAFLAWGPGGQRQHERTRASESGNLGV